MIIPYCFFPKIFPKDVDKPYDKRTCIHMWNFGDIVYWGCVMLEMWDVGDVGCWGCRMFAMWDVPDVGCSGCGMFGMWDVGC